jgi:transglutaminase-like putative cysteine protease
MVLLCLAFLAVEPALAAKPEAVPDWVRDAAAQTLPSYPAETAAVVLKEDTIYTVQPDGQAVEHLRRVVKILRPQGRDEATIHVEYDDETKLLLFHVWSIGADGHAYAMQDKEYSDVGNSTGGVEFTKDRFRVARAPAADPGAVIAYEYEQRTRPFMSETTWFVQEDIPRLSQSFVLEMSPGYTYTTNWSHHAAMDGRDMEGSRWRWELHDVAGVDLRHVPLAPAAESLMGRMTVHYSGRGLTMDSGSTWSGIGQWYAGLSRDRLTPTPEVAARAQALTAGKSDFADKAEAIGEFVQRDVRYFAVEVGVGGYQPHPAGEIYKHMYGDCKDKATLTASMLSAVGIHAALLMVDTNRGVVDPAAPSLVGNHMITAIELPSGYTSPRLASVVTAQTGRRYLIFDPTWEKTSFGELEANLQGGYGILMEGAQTEAIALPVLDPALDTVRRTGTFRLGADGAIRGMVRDVRFGDVSEQRREMYSNGDAKEQQEYLDHVLEQDLSNFKALRGPVCPAGGVAADGASAGAGVACSGDGGEPKAGADQPGRDDARGGRLCN